MEVVPIKKYLDGIDPLVYTFIVLEDRYELFQSCPPYPLWKEKTFKLC